MKVNYTLPGFRPEADLSKDLVESFDSPFKNRMQAFEQRPSVGWKELLGLNLSPPDDSQIAQSRSNTRGVADPVLLRQQWRDLLIRHAGPQELEKAPEPVRRMLELLQSYQRESDSMFSRGVSEAQR